MATSALGRLRDLLDAKDEQLAELEEKLNMAEGLLAEVGEVPRRGIEPMEGLLYPRLELVYKSELERIIKIADAAEALVLSEKRKKK
jgi:hypothetical protein